MHCETDRYLHTEKKYVDVRAVETNHTHTKRKSVEKLDDGNRETNQEDIIEWMKVLPQLARSAQSKSFSPMLLISIDYLFRMLVS